MFDLNELVELATEIESNDRINWNNLNISKDHAFRLMAAGILEHLETIKDPNEQLKISIAIAINLSVENLILNIKLLTRDNND